MLRGGEGASLRWPFPAQTVSPPALGFRSIKSPSMQATLAHRGNPAAQGPGATSRKTQKRTGHSCVTGGRTCSQGGHSSPERSAQPSCLLKHHFERSGVDVGEMSGRQNRSHQNLLYVTFWDQFKGTSVTRSQGQL